MPDHTEQNAAEALAVLGAHVQIRDAHNIVRCICGGWLAVMPGGSPGDDAAHREHVAEQVAEHTRNGGEVRD